MATDVPPVLIITPDKTSFWYFLTDVSEHIHYHENEIIKNITTNEIINNLTNYAAKFGDCIYIPDLIIMFQMKTAFGLLCCELINHLWNQYLITFTLTT